MTRFNESFGQWRDRLLATPDEQRAMWAELGAMFTTRPVCPECARFIHPALWDTHMATHHDNRVGLAEEAKNPPPSEEDASMAEEWEIDVWVYADTAKVATDAALDKHPGSEVIFVERYKEGQFRITLASHTPFLPEEE